MKSNGFRSNDFLTVAGLLISLCVLTVSVGGCTPLRQKFTRKKKEKINEQAFVPVLDPIDYPPPSVSPQERYRYNYSLWKVWQRDLVQKIESNESDKTQKYLVSQIITRLEEMKKWVAGVKHEELAEAIGEWNAILALYDQPAAMRSMMSVKRKVETSAKKVRNQFNPEAVKGFLISGQ